MTHPKLTPEQQAIIRELNGLAHQLTQLPRPVRDEQAREMGLKSVQAARPKRERKSRRRIIIILAVFLSCLLSVYFLAAAALPGQKLYALKRATENIRDSLTFTAVGKATNDSRSMTNRAQEFATLSKDNKRLAESTVDKLITEILLEAKEFEAHIHTAPADQQFTLRSQRQSDAAAVASVLIKIDKSAIPDSQQQLVKDAITTLRRIADG